MASPFQKYQAEQVQQIPAGYVEAMGSMGRAYASIGQSIAGGIQEADKRAEQEQITKGKLAAYLRSDPRTLAVEEGISAGWLIKDADGVVSVAPSKESMIDPKASKPYIDFYNTTGGDGSRLEGRALTRFVSEYDEQEKLNKARDAARIESDKAKIDADLKRAQIADLQSKALERQANAGFYGAALQGMGFGAAAPAGGGLTAPVSLFGAYNAPPAGSLTLSNSTPQPVDPTGTLPLSTAYTGPTSEPQAVATTTPAPATTAVAPAAAEPVYTPEDFDAKGYLKKKPAPAAEQPNVRKDAEIKPVQSTQAVAPAVAPATPAVATVKAAPIVYDIPAKTEETNKILKGLDDKRAATIKTYGDKRVATQANLEVAKRSLGTPPRNKTGFDIARTSLDYNKTIMEGIDAAEKRELANIDTEAESAKTSLRLYASAADAQRAATKMDMDVAAATEKTTLESAKLRSRLVKEYPIRGVFSHLGYNMRSKDGKLMDPAELGTAGLDAAQKGEVDATYDGYLKATDFLIRMDDISKRRSEIGGEWSQRFRLLANDMENYFQGELASTFGVATFRRAIVSGGNFSDADREFVKAAITYLNTASPDMTQSDLESSTRALAVFINAMYQRGLESRNMRYAPENAKKQADAYRELGDEGGARFIEGQIKDSEVFYNRFALKPTKDTFTKQFGAEVDAARAVLWGTLSKGKALKSEFAGSNPTLQRNPSTR